MRPARPRRRCCSNGSVPRIRFAVALACAAALLTLVLSGTVLGEASHAGWPQINGRLEIDKGPPGGHRVLRGDANRHNELLGGYGNDTIYGGNAGDVLWADYHPSGQPVSQVTAIYAGNGKNFIYTSHGTTFVHSGTNPATTVFAHFGSGKITCGSPDQVVTVSHRSQRTYKFVGCKRFLVN